MRVLIAPDSFKECLTATEATEAIALGLTDERADLELDRCPVADGGEGTVDALVAAADGRPHDATVEGPLGAPVEARYGLLADGTAVLEMAAASGLGLVARDRRDPLRASTFGTGQLLEAARRAGARRVILGIGGSATSDGGAGALAALGMRLLDADDQPLRPGGGGLSRLARIDPAGVRDRWRDVPIEIACDVDNPMLGPRGAAATYGPQKGATDAEVRVLDAGLARFAEIAERDLGRAVSELPGAGAAGGLGAGLVAGLGATLGPGAELVFGAVDLDRRLAGADLVITGEGAIDATTAQGKLIGRLVARCAARQVPVVALVGTLGDGWHALLDQGLTAAFSLAPGPAPLERLIAEAGALLRRQARQVFRLFSVSA